MIESGRRNKATKKTCCASVETEIEILIHFYSRSFDTVNGDYFS